MKSSGIGGQAVLEGVMMKNRNRYAVAVRKPDGEIEVKTQNCKGENERAMFFRLPIIRGMVALVDSLVLGMSSLTYSSSFYEEEEEKERQAKKEAVAEEDKEAERKKKEKQETMENVLIVALSVVLAVAFFVILPLFLSELLRSKISSQTALAVIEGVLRILLFVAYVAAISCMSDIKRVFMYHGAEHKTINCVENGLDLNVENVRKQSRYHCRCGTSFLLIVMFISILFFVFIQVPNMWLRMVVRILLVPVIAGVSYEFIRFAGSTDNKVVAALSKPGMLLQKLTTKEPDDQMIEVAIASVEAVFDWKKYQRQMASQKKGKKTLQKNTDKKKKKMSQKEDTHKKDDLTEREACVTEESLEEKNSEAGKKKVRKSRAQTRRELKEREERYRQNKMERLRQMQEQEKREAALEQKYRDIEKRHAARRAAAMAEKVEIPEDDALESLDHYFDEPSADSESEK